MIKDLKMSIKLMPYCTNWKSTLAGMVIFFVIGLVFEIAMGGEMPAGVIFMMMAGIFPAQLLTSLSVSSLVATSTYKRKLQTDYSTVIIFVTSLIAWTVCCATRYFNYVSDGAVAGMVINGMLGTALIMLVLAIYMALAYKVYWIAFTIFIVSYLVIYVLISLPFEYLNHAFTSFPVAVVFGYVMVFVSTLVHNLLTKAVYKIPMHKMAQSTILRKAMK